MERVKNWIRKHRDLLMYLFFGVLTTVVNYAVYLPCYNLLELSAAFSNLIAWAAAVLFAYVTNKPFVFQSHDWSMDTVIPEFAKFVGCRLGSGFLETGILFAAVDWLGMDGNLWKLLTAVLVVVLNYAASKLFVFRGA